MEQFYLYEPFLKQRKMTYGNSPLRANVSLKSSNTQDYLVVNNKKIENAFSLNHPPVYHKTKISTSQIIISSISKLCYKFYQYAPFFKQRKMTYGNTPLRVNMCLKSYRSF